GTPARYARARQDDPGYGAVCLTGRGSGITPSAGAISRTSRPVPPGQEPVADMTAAVRELPAGRYRPADPHVSADQPPRYGAAAHGSWCRPCPVRSSQGRTERSHMNTTRGSTRRSRLIKMTAAVGAGLIIAGLAAVKPVPAHDPTIDQAPAVTMTADEPMLREGGRDAPPTELPATPFSRPVLPPSGRHHLGGQVRKRRWRAGSTAGAAAAVTGLVQQSAVRRMRSWARDRFPRSGR